MDRWTWHDTRVMVYWLVCAWALGRVLACGTTVEATVDHDGAGIMFTSAEPLALPVPCAFAAGRPGAEWFDGDDANGEVRCGPGGDSVLTLPRWMEPWVGGSVAVEVDLRNINAAGDVVGVQVR